MPVILVLLELKFAQELSSYRKNVVLASIMFHVISTAQHCPVRGPGNILCPYLSFANQPWNFLPLVDFIARGNYWGAVSASKQSSFDISDRVLFYECISAP